MNTRRWRSATTGVLVLLAGLFVGVTASAAAHADAPSPLGPGRIDDRAGALSDAEETRLEQRLDALASSDGLPELFVVLVPDFDDPDNALAWADETAVQSNLASDQYLLAIATEGRSLAISAEYGGGGVASGPLSESRVLDIEDRLGSDFLSRDDWEGGIGYVVDEFSTVPWPWWVWALGAVVLAAIVFVVTRLVLFLRRRAQLAAELRTLDGQKKRTAQRLVQVDEAVRTSEQELGFVTAEFGEETTAEFAAVLTENKARVQQGFQLLEKLQDADEDAPEEIRSWVDEILELCTQIDASLDERRGAIAALRGLAESAPDNLARLRSARADAEILRSDAAERLDALTTVFPAIDLVGVARNADQIGARLRAVDVQLDALQKAAERRRPRAISAAVHEAERLLAEATDLHEAIDAQATALAVRSAAPPAPGSAAADRARPDASVPQEGPSDQTSGSGSVLDQAIAAVRAAATSVQARPGEVGSFALMRLNAAERELAVAQASAGTEDGEMQAKTALATAQQVQSLIGAPAARARDRFVRPAPVARTALMYDTSDSDDHADRHRSYETDDDSEGRGGRAVIGGLSGGTVGFFSSLSVAREEPGAMVLFVIGGAVLGAISSAFGNRGDSSSSGWGGSPGSSGGRSWGGGRSGGSRSGGSSGGSRSSGRSGGRRF